MKRLKPFSYYEPKTVEEAIEILCREGQGGYPLAGGTDLLVRMKRGEIHPSYLVNLKRIQGFNEIRQEPKGISIGALTSISAIEHSPLVRAGCPVLGQAASVLGSPSVRNIATLGGNVGRASPASDMTPSLVILGAEVNVAGPKGKRAVKIEQVFSGPGKTTLQAGEVIASFFIPRVPEASGASYLKLGRTEGMDCALVGVAACLTLSGKQKDLKDARVALSAVAPVPLRARRAEEVLLSGPLNEERLKEAARVAAEESSPITDMRASASYRKEMVKVFAFRALSRALELAQRGG